MSHVATVDLEIKDMAALREACDRLGLELVEGQKTYRWYGTHVGDYPLPAGFSADELGRCEHAIRIRDYAGDRADGEAPYEIGVVRRRDGRPGYSLLWDFFAGGLGLQKHVGDGCCKLKAEYARAVAVRQAMAQGFSVTEQRQPNGAIRLVLAK